MITLQPAFCLCVLLLAKTAHRVGHGDVQLSGAVNNGLPRCGQMPSGGYKSSDAQIIGCMANNKIIGSRQRRKRDKKTLSKYQHMPQRKPQCAYFNQEHELCNISSRIESCAIKRGGIKSGRIQGCAETLVTLTLSRSRTLRFWMDTLCAISAE